MARWTNPDNITITTVSDFLQILERFKGFVESGKMYDVEPDYGFLPRVKELAHELYNHELFEYFYTGKLEDLYDLLDEYIDERDAYEEYYAIFENRYDVTNHVTSDDSEWFDEYTDGFDPDNGPQEIEDYSDSFEDLIEESIDEVQVLKNLRVLRSLKLPEDVKRVWIRKHLL
jgi:hypothetical protein